MKAGLEHFGPKHLEIPTFQAVREDRMIRPGRRAGEKLESAIQAMGGLDDVLLKVLETQ
jgi:hypothetical protein